MSRRSQLRLNVRTAKEEFALSMKALREADNAFILASDAVRAVQDAVDAVNRAEAALREADPPGVPLRRGIVMYFDSATGTSAPSAKPRLDGTD